MPRPFQARALRDLLDARHEAAYARVTAGTLDAALRAGITPQEAAMRLLPDRQPLRVLWDAPTSAGWLSTATGLDLHDVVTAAMTAQHLHANYVVTGTESDTTIALAAAAGADTATVANMGRAIDTLPIGRVFTRITVRPRAGTLEMIEARLTLPVGGDADAGELLRARPDRYALTVPRWHLTMAGSHPMLVVRARSSEPVGKLVAQAQIDVTRWGTPQVDAINDQTAAWLTRTRDRLAADLTARRDMLAALDRLAVD